MSVGQGSVKFTGLTLPSVPPFPAGAADNGLSVDPVTGNIVLGDLAPAGFGSPGQFLNDRSLQLSAFRFDITDGIVPHFLIDTPASTDSFGDMLGLLGGGALVMDHLNKTAFLRADNGNGSLLSLDGLNFRSELGPGLGAGNNTTLIVDDGNQVVWIGDQLAANRILSLDRLNALYQLGDIDNAGNGVRLTVDDASNAAKIGNNIADFLLLDIANMFFAIGDINAAGNGTRLAIDDGLMDFTATTTTGRMLVLDQIAGNFLVGDIDGLGNSSVMEVDDPTSRILLRANNGFSTSDPGFTTGNGLWLLGDIVVAASVLDATQYLEVQVSGVPYKLALAV